MNVTATGLRPVCAAPGCGAVLSVYRPRGETLCAACRRRASEAEAEGETVDLERLIAGILLTNDALNPGEPVYLAMELAAYGVVVDAERVRLAVRHLGSRHGIIAGGRKGQPGYTVNAWERRYRVVTGYGGLPMDRDPATGKWSGLLPQPAPLPEVLSGQLPFSGSDWPSGGETGEPDAAS